MQMLCKVAAGFSDVRCPVCNQGFLVYWTRSRELSRTEQRQSLQGALRAQHTSHEAADIHAPSFQLPDCPAPLPVRVPEPMPSTMVPVYQ